MCLAVAAASLAGCHHAKSGTGGDGGSTDDMAATSSGIDLSGVGGGGDLASVPPGTLVIILRDFKLYNSGDSTTNPDFENPPYNIGPDGGSDPGFGGDWPDAQIVTNALGADHKPVYKMATGGTVTTHGAASFAQWYNDVPGTNIHVNYPLVLTQASDGSFGYDSNVSGPLYADSGTARGFFPMDDGSMYATAFGDQGDAHNYSFTAESHNQFTYNGGETFKYRGDDDVFVYINNVLVINMGGIHNADETDVSLDSLGLTKGNTYPLDFFFAERHATGSNLLFTTTLNLTTNPIQ